MNHILRQVITNVTNVFNELLDNSCPCYVIMHERHQIIRRQNTTPDEVLAVPAF